MENKSKTFFRCVEKHQLNAGKEYKKLCDVFDINMEITTGEEMTFSEFVEKHFLELPFRGTCLSLKEFDELHNFKFTKEEKEATIEDLVELCEYLYNMMVSFLEQHKSKHKPCPIELYRYLNCIEDIMAQEGYKKKCKRNIWIFQKKDKFFQQLHNERKDLTAVSGLALQALTVI